jgi:hypothetical protein
VPELPAENAAGTNEFRGGGGHGRSHDRLAVAMLAVAVPHLLEINTLLPDNHPGDMAFALPKERHRPPMTGASGYLTA